MVAILLVLASFFFAAIPWGLVLGLWLKGVDIRKGGSGATGTTNSLRMLGWRIAVVVLLLDLGKGAVPVLLARWLDMPNWAIALSGVAAVAGHCWSPYIQMKGGKGVATGGGAAIAMFPWVIVFLLVVAIIVWLTKYVSLASLLSSAFVVVVVSVLSYFGYAPAWWAVGIALMAGIIVVQHRGNIQRLLNGTERKFGQKEAVQH